MKESAFLGPAESSAIAETTPFDLRRNTLDADLAFATAPSGCALPELHRQGTQPLKARRQWRLVRVADNGQSHARCQAEAAHEVELVEET